jgi:hypothetical protein
LIGDADVLVELNQVCADAEQDVLAVVDNFSSAGMLVGRCATAEERALLKERDPKPRVRQGAGGGESGEAASGDGDSRLGWSARHSIRPFGIFGTLLSDSCSIVMATVIVSEVVVGEANDNAVEGSLAA